MINLKFNIKLHGNDSIEKKCVDMLDMPELNRQLMHHLGTAIALACRFGEDDNAHVSGFTVEKQPDIFEPIYDVRVVDEAMAPVAESATPAVEDNLDDR